MHHIQCNACGPGGARQHASVAGQDLGPKADGSDSFNQLLVPFLIILQLVSTPPMRHMLSLQPRGDALNSIRDFVSILVLSKADVQLDPQKDGCINSHHIMPVHSHWCVQTLGFPGEYSEHSSDPYQESSLSGFSPSPCLTCI